VFRNNLSHLPNNGKLYTTLKEDRPDASYKSKFNQETIQNYENKVLNFINKTEEISIIFE
jgi:hypothetical protein